VLADGEPVRDHWQVLARRDLEQDRIRTRRTWLQGRKTGRAALVLSFAPVGQALDGTLTVGTDADADLVFYPGAVPLRAVVLTKHDALDGSPPAGDTIAGLLAAYAAALAGDPWLDSCGPPSWTSRRPAPRFRPCPTRPATPCRCTRAPATAGRCSRSRADAR